MSTCKDCLHFDVCEAVRGRPDLVGKNSLRVAEKHCPYNSFSDKPEWVHLPCKVFDDVYLIHNGAIEKCIVEGIHYTKKSSYVRLRPYHQDYLGNWSKYFTPSIHSFLKTIFLTREQAEKALEEKRKEDEGK